MRYLLLVGAVILAGCQTAGGGRSSPEAAIAKLPPACPMRVTFPDAVTFTDDTANQSLPPGSRHIVLSSVLAGAHYGMSCTCSPDANSRLMTSELARKAREKDLAPDGWTLTESKFSDAGAVKTIRDRATVINYAGTYVRKMVAQVEGNCIFTAEGIGRPADENAIDRFLGTFRDSRVPAANPNTVTAPRSAQQDPSSRLRELQRLRDQVLITQQEFDEKRREILGGL